MFGDRRSAERDSITLPLRRFDYATPLSFLCGLLVTFALAQDAKTKQVQAKRGTLKAVDAEKGMVTIPVVRRE
jgi:hypothetical protein